MLIVVWMRSVVGSNVWRVIKWHAVVAEKIALTVAVLCVVIMLA